MKTLTIFSINFKKLKTRPKKAMFLIIPVAILITLSVVISSQINNINTALKNGVFDTISDQYTMLTVTNQSDDNEFNPSNMFKGQSSFESNEFSYTDVENIENIDGVESASLVSSIPIDNVYTTDLFTDKTVSLSNISTLDEDTAGLYTSESFTYTEGEAIPIILSASSLKYTYEDWSSGDTITYEMIRPQQDSRPTSNDATSEKEPGNRMSVEKTEAIEYSKDDLIGKTFTISFGGLDDIQDYTSSIDRDTQTMTITKLTDEEYSANVEERKTSISSYWNYDVVSSPISYTFVVVGILEDETSNINYIPTDFANVVMSDLISNEMIARVVDEIDVDVLNTDFIGLTYDGDELSSGSMGGMLSQIGGRMEMQMGSGNPKMPNTDSESFNFENISFSAITIPGLVIDIDDNTVVGTLDDTEIYSTANKYSTSINVIISSITDRDSVIEALNDAGYAYQDVSNLDVFNNLESTLKKVSNTFLVSFIVLVGCIVILTMGKLVSESTREIGIFRAIGMKKGNILLMFVLQSLLYVCIGYIVGLVFGIGINLFASGIVSSWFNSFLEETVSQTFNVVNTVESSVFMGVNWLSILIYTILLFVISLVVSIIPSLSASKISPVEAIKSE